MKNLQHVSNVMVLQESISRASVIIETFSISTLVEDCLFLFDSEIKKENITIEWKLADIPPVKSVTHKLQQILINVIKNAIESLVGSEKNDKKLILSTRTSSSNLVQIVISDNGVGIPKDNLKKIFSFGFTTKKNGHGYGLHNSILLAKELRGTLFLEDTSNEDSTTFIIEIPLE